MTTPSADANEVGGERCDALIAYVLRAWPGQVGGKPRTPRDLEVLLRCRKPLDHAGQHVSPRTVRKWTDDFTTGWIDPGEDPEPVTQNV